MLIEQIIDFELRGPGPPGRISSSSYWVFSYMKKQKLPRNIVQWIILLLTAKILQEPMYLTSPYPGQITYKILPQSARFKTCFRLKL